MPQEKNSGLRKSEVSSIQAKNMKINVGISNVTGDTIFKQANSTTSNHG